MYLFPLLSSPASRIPGGFRDSYSILWQVWWFGKSLFQEHCSPFHTTWHAYPEGEHYVSYQNLLFYLPAAAIGRFTGPVAATNIMVLLSLWLTGWSAFILLREIHGNGWGALSGAALLLSCSFVSATLHSGIYYLVLSAGFMCLALFLGTRARRLGRVRDWLAAGAALSAVGLTSGYCFIVACAAWPIIFTGRTEEHPVKKGHCLKGHLIAGAVALCLLAIPYGLMLRNRGASTISAAGSYPRHAAEWKALVGRSEKSVSGFAEEDSQYMVNHIGYFPFVLGVLGLALPGGRKQKTAGLGLGVHGLTLPGSRERRTAVLVGLMTAAFVLVATGCLPGVNTVLGKIGMRNVHRFLLGASLCLSWLAARAVSSLMSAPAGSVKKAAAASVVILAIAESLAMAGPPFPVHHLSVAATEVDDYLAALSGEAVVELPLTYPYFSNTMRAYASQVHHGKKLANPGTNVFSKTVLTVEGKEILGELERCIREHSVFKWNLHSRDSQVESLRLAGVAAVVLNEGYLARIEGSSCAADAAFARTVFDNILGEPVISAGGRTVYLLAQDSGQ